MARTEKESQEIDALGALIYRANKDGVNKAEAVWAAGYRIDPYPNGKTKDELIARIEVVEAERDRARNLLREEHAKYIKEVFSVTMDRHRDVRVDCPVCAFLTGTPLVKP